MKRIRWPKALALMIALPLTAWGAQADPLPSQQQGTPAQSAAPPQASNAPAPTGSSTPATAPAQPLHGPGSGMYNIGYNDGCATSNLRYARESGTKPNRDSKLYDNDQDYHDGWNKGYRHCENKVNQGGLPVMGNSVIQ